MDDFGECILMWLEEDKHKDKSCYLIDITDGKELTMAYVTEDEFYVRYQLDYTLGDQCV